MRRLPIPTFTAYTSILGAVSRLYTLRKQEELVVSCTKANVAVKDEIIMILIGDCRIFAGGCYLPLDNPRIFRHYRAYRNIVVKGTRSRIGNLH